MPTESRHADLRGLRVLVVDDNATNRRVVNGMLTASRCLPTSVPGAAEALVELRAAAGSGQPYDVALLDLNMPEVDGLQLAREIRQDPALGGLVLLLLTSSGQRGQAEQSAEAGINGYLAKPIRAGQLDSVLLGCIGRDAAEPRAAVTLAMPTAERIAARLLLAEDNPVNRKVAVHTLRRVGYDVEVVGNGQEALDALARNEYDAVLMDCQMPVLDGFSATEELRRREAGGRRTPVIALTASAMASDRDRCLAAGMDDYLTKPLRAADLAAVLLRWLGPPGASGAAHPPSVPTARTPADDSPAVSRQVLADLLLAVGAGDGLLQDLIGTYLAEDVALLDRLAAAAELGDAVTVARLAHHLRSSSASLGALGLAELLEEIEEVARARPHALGASSARLAVERGRVVAELEQLLG